MRWALVVWGLIISTMLSALAWGAVLFFVSPDDATGFEWAIFLSTLLLVLTGACSLFVLLVRRVFIGVDRALMRVGTSVRQGLFLAVFSLGILLLMRAEWLAWWDALLLFSFFFLIELFFLRKFRIKTSE